MPDASTAAPPPYAVRPKEQAFFNVDELGEHVAQTRDGATRMVAPTGSLRIAPSSDGLRLEVPTEGRSLRLSYRAAQHLCKRAGVTPRFLEQISPETAALALNECLASRTESDDTVLLRANRDEAALSLVSPRYAEAWDADIIDAIARPLAKAGWFVPPYSSAGRHPRARPAAAHEVLPPQRGNTLIVEAGRLIEPMGARSSDRNMHLFLVHPDRVVDTADIMGRKAFRGLTLRHSETGDGSLCIEGFVFDFICGNYMMFGSRQVFRLRMVHHVSRTHEFVAEAERRMKAATRKLAGETDRMTDVARAAARIELSPDREQRALEVELMLMQARVGRIFSRAFITRAIRHAGWGKYGAENTAWAVASGLTEEAQRVTRYAERRAIYDVAAARFLDWAVTHA